MFREMYPEPAALAWGATAECEFMCILRLTKFHITASPFYTCCSAAVASG